MEKLSLIPDQAAYSYGQDTSVVSIELDGGYSRSRVDQVNSSSIVDCQWTLKDIDYQYFMAFYKAVTQKGVTAFLIDLILDQPVLEEHEAKFVPGSVDVGEVRGLTYQVSAELEVIPVYDEEFAQSIVDTYTAEGYGYLTNDLEVLVNTYMGTI